MYVLCSHPFLGRTFVGRPEGSYTRLLTYHLAARGPSARHTHKLGDHGGATRGSLHSRSRG